MSRFIPIWFLPPLCVAACADAGSALDLAHHTGRWEPTPFVGGLVEMVDTAASMGRLEDDGSGPRDPGDTSDPSH